MLWVRRSWGAKLKPQWCRSARFWIWVKLKVFWLLIAGNVMETDPVLGSNYGFCRTEILYAWSSIRLSRFLFLDILLLYIYLICLVNYNTFKFVPTTRLLSLYTSHDIRTLSFLNYRVKADLLTFLQILHRIIFLPANLHGPKPSYQSVTELNRLSQF